jgi:thiol:disulfide interchange protein
MERVKSSIVPLLLIVVFGIAFAAGIKSLNARNPSESAANGLDMASDTETAFSRAMKEDKLVMVKYGAEWCGPCRSMKEEAFPDGKVAAALSGVIVVDVDIDSPGDDSEWMSKHDIGPIPTVEFYHADGSLIGSTVGYGDVESFVAEVEKILSKA